MKKDEKNGIITMLMLVFGALTGSKYAAVVPPFEYTSYKAALIIALAPVIIVFFFGFFKAKTVLCPFAAICCGAWASVSAYNAVISKNPFGIILAFISDFLCTSALFLMIRRTSNPLDKGVYFASFAICSAICAVSAIIRIL